MGNKLNKKLVASVLGVFMIVTPFFTGCGTKETNVDAGKEVATGFQWEVKKGDKSMYLIGTMHPINTEYNYFSDKINNIMEKTDILGVEINPTQDDMIQANAGLVYSGDKTIENELNKEEIEALKGMSKELGLEYDKLKYYKSNMIIQSIQAVMYQEAGLTLETFDDKLIETSKESGKEVKELENMKFQMELLQKIHGVETLKEMLKEYSKESLDNQKKEVVDYSKGLMDAYLKGDEKVMEEAIQIQKENKEVYDAMILDRNKGMVSKMEEYFKEDKTYTIAVGALHFFGDDGIVKMMQDKGYEVNKL